MYRCCVRTDCLRSTRLAAVCARLLLGVCFTILVTGCTGEAPPQQCTSNEECNDGTFCNGMESCEPESEAADSRGCLAGVNPCPEQARLCVEQSQQCVQCTTDADCDDDVFCNGVEVCMNNACHLGEDPCEPESPICDEDSDTCLCLCASDADCDDDSFCNGVETCVDCACAAGENPCTDDGVFCNGTESCDEELDTCSHSGNPCDGVCCVEAEGACILVADCPCTTDGDCFDDGVFCNGEEACGENGICYSAGDPCTGECPFGGFCDEVSRICIFGSLCESDDDCPDDGLFCNGLEFCDEGCCRSSGDPCEVEDDGDPCTWGGSRICNEDFNQCDPGAIPDIWGIEFTLACDNLSGSSGSDDFIAGLEFNPQTGTVLQTLQSCDSANGGACDDRLSIDLLNSSTPIAPQIINIEEISIRSLSTSPLTFSLENCTGITSIDYTSGPNAGVMTISNIAQLIRVGFRNSTASANFIFLESATSSSNDTLMLYLSAVVGSNATVSLTTATTNGIETLNIETYGLNNFSDIVMNGTTLTTVNISGNAGLSIANSFDANVTLINASANLAGVNLKATQSSTITFMGSAGDDWFTAGAGADIIEGREGDDTIEAGAGIDTLSGNAGADVFRLSSDSSADRDVISDFDDTPTTGDRMNFDSDAATLSGTDNFTSSASLQPHMISGDLTISTVTEVVVVRSGIVANFTDANSLNGANLLTAIGGVITYPAQDGQFLFAVADVAGNVGVYFGDAGSNDATIAATELSLVAVLQGSSINIADLAYSNFSNAP